MSHPLGRVERGNLESEHFMWLSAYEFELLIVNQSRDGSTIMRIVFAFVSPIYHLSIIQLSAVKDLGEIGNRGQDEWSSILFTEQLHFASPSRQLH